MNSYFGLFKMTFKGELQYRAQAISGILTQFFWGIMYVYLYTAFMKNKIMDGFSISQMTTYVWLGQAFFALRFITPPKNCLKEITSGDVCYKFTRPISIYNQWFFEHLGTRTSATLLRFLPICLIAGILPASIGMSAPASALHFLLFVVALIIGALMASTISMIGVWISFKTMSSKGAFGIVTAVTNLLAGVFIPIPLMPKAVQDVLMWTPFRYISDLPFRIYIGNVTISQTLMQLGIAFAWIVILIIVGKLLLKLAFKKTVIQGG